MNIWAESKNFVCKKKNASCTCFITMLVTPINNMAFMKKEKRLSLAEKENAEVCRRLTSVI